MAAKYGELDALQWAREHGCPWDEMEVSQAAAWGGHLGVLQWTREHGCPLVEDICVYAAQEGHLEVFKWARAIGCPCPDLNLLFGRVWRTMHAASTSTF